MNVPDGDQLKAVTHSAESYDFTCDFLGNACFGKE